MPRRLSKPRWCCGVGIGSILCAASTDYLIPPSIPFVIYAMLADESVGRLFIGGILPGLVLAVALVFTVWVWVLIDPKVAPIIPSVPWKERFKSLPKIWAILLLVIVVMGGLWGGIFTANEAAGIGASGAFVISLAMRRLTWKGTVKMFIETGAMTANIFFLIASVQVFNNFMGVMSLPTLLANWVVGLHLSPMTVLLFILFIYGVLGIPLEMPPIIILTVPIFVPLLVSVGIDKVWFGILSTITVGRRHDSTCGSADVSGACNRKERRRQSQQYIQRLLDLLHPNNGHSDHLPHMAAVDTVAAKHHVRQVMTSA